jgi:hypothetical protein
VLNLPVTLPCECRYVFYTLYTFVMLRFSESKHLVSAFVCLSGNTPRRVRDIRRHQFFIQVSKIV